MSSKKKLATVEDLTSVSTANLLCYQAHLLMYEAELF